MTSAAWYKMPCLTELLGFAYMAAKHTPLHSGCCGNCYASVLSYFSFVIVSAFACDLHHVTFIWSQNPHAQQLTHEFVNCSTATLAGTATTASQVMANSSGLLTASGIAAGPLPHWPTSHTSSQEHPQAAGHIAWPSSSNYPLSCH